MSKFKKLMELTSDIKPDVIKSFNIKDSLNTKIWKDGKLKPEIREKLLVIGKNFFKDLQLEPNVKLYDITLTGSISNYNWSKFSDVDLHLRIKFSEVDDDADFVKNYVLAKKTVWNNKHDISIYGFPVEVYVENVGESHVASGLYSILKNKWLVVPKKKELQIDLDDIRSKAEGYLGSIPVLQKMIKDGKYKEVIEMVEKIQAKLKRMRSSGLASGGEFSVENLAFKALRRSPFIADIIQMKNDAYDKSMTMERTHNLMEASSNISGYSADEGEPDTGFIRGNKKRKLGTLSGKPEPWFERGGYTQTIFPKADYIYGKGEDEQFSVRKKAYMTKIDKDFEAEFVKWEEWVPDEDFEEQNTLKESGYKKIMKNILLERVDYMDSAKQLVKQYGLNSKIQFGSGKNFGEYIPETDTITLRKSYKSVKDFLMTVLHEIKHALDAKRLGTKKFIKKYTQAGTMAQYDGLDPHDDNKWEEKAERFAKQELSKWM